MNKKLDWKQFIQFWKQFYADSGKTDEDYYKPYINNRKLTRKSMCSLWKWKMQDKYARFQGRRDQVEKMCNNIQCLNEF